MKKRILEELEVPKEACHLTTADAKGRCRSGSAEPPGSLPPLPRSLYWRDDDVLEAEGAWKGAEGHSVICRNLLYFVLSHNYSGLESCELSLCS